MARYYYKGKSVTKTQFQRLTATKGSAYSSASKSYKETLRKREEEEKKASRVTSPPSVNRPSASELYNKPGAPAPMIKKSGLYAELSDYRQTEQVKEGGGVKKTILTMQEGELKPSGYEMTPEYQKALEEGQTLPTRQTGTYQQQVRQAYNLQREANIQNAPARYAAYTTSGKGSTQTPKPKNWFQKLDDTFGITGPSKNIRELQEKYGEDQVKMGIAPAAGLKGGVTIVRNIGKGAKALKTGYQATRATKTGTWVIGLGKGIIGSQIIAFGAKKSAVIGAPSEQQKFLQDKNFQSILGSARAKQTEIAQEGALTGIGNALSMGLSGSKANKAFEDEIRLQLKAQGYSEGEISKAIQAAERQQKYDIGGEIGGLLFSGYAAGEETGRRLVGLTLNQAAKEGLVLGQKSAGKFLFKKTFVPIGLAGFNEGFSQELVQQTSRNHPLDLKKATVSGGIGFGTAGLIGGTIAATSINKKGLSRFIAFGANIADPLEKPSDIITDLTELGGKKIFGRSSVITPSMTIIGSQEPTVTFGNGKSARGKGKTNTIINTIGKGDNIVTSIQGKTKNFVPSIKGIFSNTPTTTRTTTPVDTKPIINIPTEIIIGSTPINPTPEVPTDIITQTPTNILTPISINIPTSTPILRIPPPIPLKFGAGSGGGATTIGKKTKFINELAIGRALLLGGEKKITKKKSKKSKKNLQRKTRGAVFKFPRIL